jgi:hypothetical protein
MEDLNETPPLSTSPELPSTARYNQSRNLFDDNYEDLEAPQGGEQETSNSTEEEESASNFEGDMFSLKTDEAEDELGKYVLNINLLYPFSAPSPSDQRFRHLFGELFDIFDKKVNDLQKLRSSVRSLVNSLKQYNNGTFYLHIGFTY